MTIKNFEIQGHCGTRGTLPENSLLGFKAAIEAGVDTLELDLLATQEGEIIIHHDLHINPILCTYLEASQPCENLFQACPLISTLSLAQIKKLDCGQRQHPLFPHQILIPQTPIPTLKELLKMIQQLDHPCAKTVRLNLEIKTHPTHPNYPHHLRSIVETIVSIVHHYQFANRVYYSSFDSTLLSEIYKQEPQALLSFIFDKETLQEAAVEIDQWIKFVIKMALELKTPIVSPDYILINKKAVKDLQEAGLRVIPWTVNQIEDCLKLQEMGVDGIITDFPAQMIGYLRNKNPLRAHRLDCSL